MEMFLVNHHPRIAIAVRRAGAGEHYLQGAFSSGPSEFCKMSVYFCLYLTMFFDLFKTRNFLILVKGQFVKRTTAMQDDAQGRQLTYLSQSDRV